MQINAEMEMDKLRSQERIELERLNLKKAKLEVEAKTNVEREREYGTESERNQAWKRTGRSWKGQHSKTKTNIRLPKLEIKKCNCDTLKWQEFWDSFEATIHKDPAVPPINKFNHLRT